MERLLRSLDNSGAAWKAPMRIPHICRLCYKQKVHTSQCPKPRGLVLSPSVLQMGKLRLSKPGSTYS